MRKNVSKIIVWIVLIFVAVRINNEFSSTPQKAIEDLFECCVTGDTIGVEVCFNNTMERASKLADVMTGMIFAGDTITNLEIVEEKYNSEENLVRVDCKFSVLDTQGELYDYRGYFYMCKSPGFGWEIYNLKSYSEVSHQQEDEYTENIDTEYNNEYSGEYNKEQYELENPDVFVGAWWDEYSRRCNMDINYAEGIYYINIYWSSSAWETTFWELTGVYDKDFGGILYKGSRKEFYTMDDGSSRENIVYEDGSGLLYLGEYDVLYWKDYKENMGEQCYFYKQVVEY